MNKKQNPSMDQLKDLYKLTSFYDKTKDTTIKNMIIDSNFKGYAYTSIPDQEYDIMFIVKLLELFDNDRLVLLDSDPPDSLLTPKEFQLNSFRSTNKKVRIVGFTSQFNHCDFCESDKTNFLVEYPLYSGDLHPVCNNCISSGVIGDVTLIRNHK